MYAEKGVKLEAAVEKIKKALEFEPDNGAFLDSLGWAYYKKGQLEKSVMELNKAVKLITDDPVIYEHLGRVYYRKGDFPQALDYLKKSLHFDPNNKDVKQSLEDLQMKIEKSK